jgi:DNA-binding LacI/PurR family transcriptional regulator
MTTGSPTSSTGRDSGTNPTLAVVARYAGVSVPTASKVINGREDVALDTRRKVEHAIKLLGYIHRRRSDSRLPRLVDVVMPYLDHGRSPVVLQAAESAMRAAGLDIVVSSTKSHGRRGRLRTGSLDKFHARGTTGLLLDSADLTRSQHAWLARHRIPYVLLDPVGDVPDEIPTVNAAERAGAASAVAHLSSLGHGRIAVITGVSGTRRCTSHVAGYRSALRVAGVVPPPEYTRYADFDGDLAEREMVALLSLPDPPSAVLVCSSLMMIGVYRALHLRGLSIPDDMSVVGFEDHSVTGWMLPQVSTVQIPVTDMAAEATRILVRMIGGAPSPNKHVELPTRLVVRHGSTVPYEQWAYAS